MGKHQLRLLQFAIKYPYGWHSYGTDESTVRAVNALCGRGLIEISDNTRQFRLALGTRPEDYGK